MHPHAPVIKTGRDLHRGLTHPAIHPPHTFSCKNSFRSCCAAIVFITDIRLFFLDTFYIQAFPEATRIVHWVKPNWSLVPGKKKNSKKRFCFHRELETPFARVRAGPGAMALTWPFRADLCSPPPAPHYPRRSHVLKVGEEAWVVTCPPMVFISVPIGHFPGCREACASPHAASQSSADTGREFPMGSGSLTYFPQGT